MTAGAGPGDQRHEDRGLWSQQGLTTVEVAAAGGAYPAHVGVGALDRIADFLRSHAPAHRYAIIADDRVAPLYGARVLESCSTMGLEASLHTFTAGEASKTRKTWSILTDDLLDAGHGRDSVVVAVGGGVTGDVGGFVAATFLRGIPVVQVPTSLLAMIDASVGGKTGVDVRAGKNLVGAFHPPRCVVADPLVLATLPMVERAHGLVEAFKHGAILDAEYFGNIERAVPEVLEADPVSCARVVLESVRLKAGVVSMDEREGGYREILNFGHTIGHALEAASDFRLGHGAAVALGMVAEARMGERVGVTEPGTADRLSDALTKLGSEVGRPASVDVDVARRFLGADKKVRAGLPRFVVLSRVGEVDRSDGWTRVLPETLVDEALSWVCG